MANINIHGGVAKVKIDHKSSAGGYVTWITIKGNRDDEIILFMNDLEDIELLAYDLLSRVKNFKEES